MIHRRGITKLISKLTSARHVHERTAQHHAHHMGADRSRSGRTHLRSCGAALASITVGLRCWTPSSEDIRTCRSIGSGGFARPGRLLYIINTIGTANPGRGGSAVDTADLVRMCPPSLTLSIIALTRSHEQLRVDVHRDRTESHRDSSDSGELVRNEN